MSYEIIEFNGAKLLVPDEPEPPYESTEKILVDGEYVTIPTRKYRVDCPACSYNADSLEKIEEHVNSEHELEQILDEVTS